VESVGLKIGWFYHQKEETHFTSVSPLVPHIQAKASCFVVPGYQEHQESSMYGLSISDLFSFDQKIETWEGYRSTSDHNDLY